MKINSENLNINLKHVRALEAIEQHGSFGAAAAELGIVPSGLSELIRQLEEAVGTPLFDRRSRPPEMTPPANEFLQQTAPLLASMERAIGALRQSANLERGTLAIGASPSAISKVLVPVLTPFLARWPNITCRLHDDIAEKLADMVSIGQLDMAVAGRARQSADLRQREILRDRIGLACSADHPLAEKSSITLSDIRPDMLIGLDRMTGTSQLLSQGNLPDAFMTPKLQAHSTVGQLCMIRSGMGVALLPQNAVSLFRDPAIRFIEIDDFLLWRSLFLLEPARRAPSPAASAFIEAVEHKFSPL